jgi:hypothetical protein
MPRPRFAVIVRLLAGRLSIADASSTTQPAADRQRRCTQ